MTWEASTPRSVIPTIKGFSSDNTPVVVYITLEYCLADLFSGNGVCARSHVRGLSRRGVPLLVIAGRPPQATPPAPEDEPGCVVVHEVPLAVWRTTDRAADHKTFARRVAQTLELLLRSGLPVAAVLAVDWTGRAALDQMNPRLLERLLRTAPLFFLNFRVYARMTNISDDDREFYHEQEAISARHAIESNGGIMSLSDTDNEALLAMHPSGQKNADAFRVILPMLREEFAQIAEQDRNIILDASRRRSFLVCLVRLSEDKGPQRFVDICEEMTRADPTIWTRTGVVPLMAGAPSQPLFAKALKERFKRVLPNCIVVDNFLNPPQLAQVLQNAVLNIHPARYEAFGMTIVEAASCGVPTVLNYEGIGASQILNPDEGAAIAVDLKNVPHVARTVARLLDDKSLLAATSYKAYKAATSWTEAEHVATLHDFMERRKSEVC